MRIHAGHFCASSALLSSPHAVHQPEIGTFSHSHCCLDELTDFTHDTSEIYQGTYWRRYLDYQNRALFKDIDLNIKQQALRTISKGHPPCPFPEKAPRWVSLRHRHAYSPRSQALTRRIAIVATRHRSTRPGPLPSGVASLRLASVVSIRFQFHGDCLV